MKKQLIMKLSLLLLTVFLCSIFTPAYASSHSPMAMRNYLLENGVDAVFLSYMEDEDIESMYNDLFGKNFEFNYSLSVLSSDGVMSRANPIGLSYILGTAMVMGNNEDLTEVTQIRVTSMFLWDESTPRGIHDNGECIVLHWSEELVYTGLFDSTIYKRNSNGTYSKDTIQSTTHPDDVTDLKSLYYTFNIGNTNGWKGTATFSLYPNGSLHYESGNTRGQFNVSGTYGHKTASNANFGITIMGTGFTFGGDDRVEKMNSMQSISYTSFEPAY